jgi:hypothetical protein
MGGVGVEWIRSPAISFQCSTSTTAVPFLPPRYRFSLPSTFGLSVRFNSWNLHTPLPSESGSGSTPISLLLHRGPGHPTGSCPPAARSLTLGSSHVSDLPAIFFLAKSNLPKYPRISRFGRGICNRDVFCRIPRRCPRCDPATFPPRIRDVPVGLPAAWLFGCPGQWLVFNPPPVISASKRIALRPPHASSISSYFLFVFC